MTLGFLRPLAGIATRGASTVMGFPLWLKAGALVLLLLGAQEIRHRVIEHGLRKTITETQSALDRERVAVAEHKTALAEVSANRDEWVNKVREQNDAITHMQNLMKVAETQAGIAAIRAFNQGRAAAEALKEPTTTVRPGADQMNEYLRQRFGGAP